MERVCHVNQMQYKQRGKVQFGMDSCLKRKLKEEARSKTSHPNNPIFFQPSQSRAGMSSPPPPALELLLDEYWFFSNTLANKPPPSPREDNSKAAGPSSRSPVVSGARRLLRTPSLPSPSNLSKVAEHAAGSGNRQQQQQQQQKEEHEEDDLNWSSIYEGVLRTRMAEAATSTSTSTSSRSAALRRAPSMPVPSSSATGQAKPTPAPAPPTSTRRRPSPRSMPRSKSGVFRAEEDNKWRSSGDLQGFRRPPALVRVQSEARSAAEVKDQLRMWAQAVACNVRQEC